MYHHISLILSFPENEGTNLVSGIGSVGKARSEGMEGGVGLS